MEDTPVLWPNSATPTDLSTLGGLAIKAARATGINDSKEIVGFNENEIDKPFMIQGSKVTALPVPPNGGVEAESINDSGVIVGTDGLGDAFGFKLTPIG